VVGGDDERTSALKVVFRTIIVRMQPNQVQNLWQECHNKRDNAYQYESANEDFPDHESPFTFFRCAVAGT
jgi:hypothetical protein